MEDKKSPPKTENTSQGTENAGDWVDDMKRELEEYIEDQGIYIRQ